MWKAFLPAALFIVPSSLVGGEDLRPATLDLREPVALAARAMAARLDPDQGHRPWFLIRGKGGIPARLEHASWDLGDMTGRYLEGLIAARRMGISSAELSMGNRSSASTPSPRRRGRSTRSGTTGT